MNGAYALTIVFDPKNQNLKLHHRSPSLCYTFAHFISSYLKLVQTKALASRDDRTILLFQTWYPQTIEK